MRCYLCKSGELESVVIEEGRTFAGRRLSAMVPAERCPSCGESYITGDDLEAFENTLAAELACGEPSGAAFKFLHSLLGMKGVELAELLDVAPETVSRWEHDKLPVDRAHFALLASMVLDRAEGRTTTLDRLRALAQPGPRPSVVRLVPKPA